MLAWFYLTFWSVLLLKSEKNRFFHLPKLSFVTYICFFPFQTLSVKCARTFATLKLLSALPDGTNISRVLWSCKLGWFQGQRHRLPYRKKYNFAILIWIQFIRDWPVSVISVMNHQPQWSLGMMWETTYGDSFGWLHAHNRLHWLSFKMHLDFVFRIVVTNNRTHIPKVPEF